MMDHIQRAFVEDIIIRRDLDPGFDGEGVKVETHEVRAGKVYDSNDIIITAFRVDHGKVKPAFGYRLDIGKLSVGLSGDTRPSENLVEHCRGVDVMIHECATSQGGPPGLSREQVRKHRESKRTFPDQAGIVFGRIKPRLAVFSHIENDAKSVEEIMRGARDHFSGHMVVGEDLMRIQITRSEITIRKDGKLLNLIPARKSADKH